jgi:hypothetical protein
MAVAGPDGSSAARGAWLVIIVLALLAVPGQLMSQEADSVTVVAGSRYAAGPIKRMLLGSKYRELWLTPIRVPVLRPDTAAGGLTVLRRGSSLQTISLLFQGANDIEYFFRSVDKEQDEGLPRNLQGTLVSYVAQDLVASKHPGAAVVVAPLLEAGGVLRPNPRMAVMGDHPLLGEHRADFVGRLGMLEERPEEGIDDSEGFGGFDRVIGAERLFERLEESAEDRVDSRAYLTARLMDLLVGDWDRHPDQWRWAEDERGETRYWLAIPRDRDNAFPYMDGLVAVVARGLRPNVLQYDEEYSNLYGMIHNAQPLDRLILPELPGVEWDSIALELRRRLTDEVIAGAVSSMPEAWIALEGESLAAKLRARRDALPEIARELYAMMATEVDIRGTDESDEATIERMADGSVRVRLVASERDDIVYFDRLFMPSETREVRVDLRGGDDRAVVSGRGGGIGIRVIGGGGDDVFEDVSETDRGTLTAFYDNRGENVFVAEARTHIDTRPYNPPTPELELETNAPPPRTWGTELLKFRPTARWPSEVGPAVGGGPSWTRYGFRRAPYAEGFSALVLYAPLHNRFELQAHGHFLRTGGGGETRLTGRASNLAAVRFHGIGNESAPDPGSDHFLVWSTEFTAIAQVVVGWANGIDLAVAPNVGHFRPDPSEGSPAAAPTTIGGREFGVGGAHAVVSLDRRDSRSYPRRGGRLEVTAEGYPLVWGDAQEAFARGDVLAVGYLPLPGPFEPTLAARVGAAQVWGDAPFQYAATVGGGSSLRGYQTRRFTGNASLHGNVELRTRFGRANLGLVRGEIGAIGLVDAGRVFADGEDSGRWHYGRGGGLWFGTFDRGFTAHLVYARGEGSGFHAGIGLPF